MYTELDKKGSEIMKEVMDKKIIKISGLQTKEYWSEAIKLSILEWWGVVLGSGLFVTDFIGSVTSDKM